MNEAALWPTWSAAAADEPVNSALRALYAQLDADIAARNPTCWLSGRCCRFESYGHRLYVTGLEIAWLLHNLDERGQARLHGPPLLEKMDGCPFQINGLCSVHALRPLGCRVFFCDATATEWQNEVYEAFLKRLRQIHQQFNLEYRYIEWRAGLAEARRYGDLAICRSRDMSVSTSPDRQIAKSPNT